MKRQYGLRLLALLGLAASGLAVSWLWGDWVQSALVRPLVALGLAVQYTLVQLPQALVWFLGIGALTTWALHGLLRAPAARPPRRRPPLTRPGPRGPVSAWETTLQLALEGPLYRRRVRRLLERGAQNRALSPQAQSFLTLPPDAPESPDHFWQGLERVLSDLQGDTRGPG